MQRKPANSRATRVCTFRVEKELLERVGRVVSRRENETTLSQFIRTAIRKELAAWERKGAA